MKSIAFLLPALLLTGCVSGSCNEANAVPLAVAAPSPCAQAAAPCSAPLAASPCAMNAPAGYAAYLGSDLGVIQTIDGGSYVRAGFAVPAGWVACGGTFLANAVGHASADISQFVACLGSSFTPTLTPSTRLVRIQRVAAPKGACAPAPAAASPCAH